jgi:hypothetical protein
MGGASLNWKRLVEKDTSSKSSNECRIFQKIDGNSMFVVARKVSTRENLFGPFQCPPESKGGQKPSYTLETRVLMSVIIMFAQDQVCDW